MDIYLINVIILYIVTTFAKSVEKKQKLLSNILLIIAILIPTIIAGLRYNVGTDYFNYIAWFEQYIDNNIYFSSKDLGFVFFIKFIQIFTRNYMWLFMISALIINSLVLLFVKKNTKEYNLGYTLFFTLYSYYSSLNITRQWIAISIFLIALNFAFENKKIKSCILILLASTFHKTALFLLPFAFIPSIKLNKKNITIVFSIILIILLSFENVVIKISKYINLTQYLNYLKNMESSGGGYAYLVFGSLTLAFMIILKREYKNLNKHNNGHFWMICILVAFAFFGPINFIFDRLTSYFVPILYVCIPNLTGLAKNDNQKKFCNFIITVISFIYMIKCLMNNGGQVVPYQTIWRFL